MADIIKLPSGFVPLTSGYTVPSTQYVSLIRDNRPDSIRKDVLGDSNTIFPNLKTHILNKECFYMVPDMDVLLTNMTIDPKIRLEHVLESIELLDKIMDGITFKTWALEQVNNPFISKVGLNYILSLLKEKPTLDYLLHDTQHIVIERTPLIATVKELYAKEIKELTLTRTSKLATWSDLIKHITENNLKWIGYQGINTEISISMYTRYFNVLTTIFQKRFV